MKRVFVTGPMCGFNCGRPLILSRVERYSDQRERIG